MREEAKMTDIREAPFFTDTLTIRKLKEILSVLPDTNEYGDKLRYYWSDETC